MTSEDVHLLNETPLPPLLFNENTMTKKCSEEAFLRTGCGQPEQLSVLLVAALAAVSLALPYKAPAYGYEEKYADLNGIERVVEYVADEHGYRADIKTNEPGTESQNPANVLLHASPVVVDAPKAYAAPRPLYQAPRYAAPAYPKY
ncbi:cuticle protein 16.8 [Trichonephila inaurata madagascariensis]|uniref:Cuticle protein 16.8 n=1 Tax=Trichonephila inaurata madagascariensis TaxID=2747483 RepID=A0A8X6YQF8_9ARAC|nr:cuticle protein 16.8 [Trichonephila inaurata madagascariensis]